MGEETGSRARIEAGNLETRLGNGMPEREGGGAICDGHALFY
jgi:hypothetical protein